MNKILFTLAGIMLVMATSLYIKNHTTPQTTVSSEQPSTFAVVQEEVGSGAVLYDVRTPEEFAAGHFQSAENWSLQNLQANNYPPVDKDATIYVYCQSGNRSGQATALLKQEGFTDVRDLGGLQDVIGIGGELIR